MHSKIMEGAREHASEDSGVLNYSDFREHASEDSGVLNYFDFSPILLTFEPLHMYPCPWGACRCRRTFEADDNHRHGFIMKIPHPSMR